MTSAQRLAAVSACIEARQAARAIGGLRERLRRCKSGSPGAVRYEKRIAEFERQDMAAADALSASLIEVQTVSENSR